MAILPEAGETTPRPHSGVLVVFVVQFEAGLSFPALSFLDVCLRYFRMEIPDLHPMAFLRMAIFEWLLWSHGASSTLALFAAFHEAMVYMAMVGNGCESVFGVVRFRI